MNMILSNKSKFLLMLTIILLGLFSLTLFAQEEDQTKSKLEQLKGKVEKITVKVDGKDVVFEGKEAEKLAKQFTQKRTVKIITDGGDDLFTEGDAKVFTVKSDGEDDEADINCKDKKEVKVEIKNDKKIVTVTTTKDGKEETKTYEGEEADKLLKEENGSKNFSLFLGGDEDMSKRKVMVLSSNDDNCCCCKKMSAKMHSTGKGMKHIIIQKNDDGKDEEGKK